MKNAINTAVVGENLSSRSLAYSYTAIKGADGFYGLNQNHLEP